VRDECIFLVVLCSVGKCYARKAGSDLLYLREDIPGVDLSLISHLALSREFASVGIKQAVCRQEEISYQLIAALGLHSCELAPDMFYCLDLAVGGLVEFEWARRLVEGDVVLVCANKKGWKHGLADHSSHRPSFPVESQTLSTLTCLR